MAGPDAPYPRWIRARVDEALDERRVVAITGARQVGKSTLAREVCAARHGTYRSLDDPGWRQVARDDPVELLRAPAPVVIDEFQLGGDDLLRAVKAQVDGSNKPGQVLLTGSTRFLTVPNLSESLAGRVGLVELWPLSQGELARRREEFVDRLFSEKDGVRTLRSDSLDRSDTIGRILAGGFPEAVGVTARSRSHWYASYVETVTQRDAREVSRVQSVRDLARVLRVLAARTAQELNVASLASELRLPRSTLDSHLALLESLHLWTRMPAWSRNVSARAVRHPKTHLTDAGLAADLCGVSITKLLAPGHPLLGPLLETFVAGELQRQRGWAETAHELFHFRHHDGPEIDVVVETRAGDLAGIEVKAASSVGAGDIAGLRRAAAQLRPKPVHCVLLYLGRDVLPFGEGFTAMPLAALWGQ
jgi:predicted AAA+ superfamily ATPase